MATPMNTQQFVELNKIGLREVFFQQGMEKPREYPFIVNVDTLDHVPAFDQQLHGTGLMPEKPEGTAFPRQSMVLGGRREWRVRPFGNAVEITFEERRDEQYGSFTRIPADQARAGRQREEEDALYFLNHAFDSAVNGFVPGEALCGDHTSIITGEVQRNAPPIGQAFGPSMTGFQQAIMHFHNLKDDDGKRSLKQPSLVIGSANGVDLFIFRELLGSTGVPYKADNELNSLIAEELSWIICHFGDFGDAWFVRADGHDAWFMWRDEPFQDTFVEPNTMNAVSASYQRHSRGEFRDWRGWWGSSATDTPP